MTECLSNPHRNPKTYKKATIIIDKYSKFSIQMFWSSTYIIDKHIYPEYANYQYFFNKT